MWVRARIFVRRHRAMLHAGAISARKAMSKISYVSELTKSLAETDVSGVQAVLKSLGYKQWIAYGFV